MYNAFDTQPAQLSQAVLRAGLSFDMLYSAQLILVLAQGSASTLLCYDRPGPQAWRFNEYLGASSGYVGRNGVSAFKKEGDGMTPTGLFCLGYAFGNIEKPETKMVYRPVTANSVWVDDPGSPHYNTWTEARIGEWTSAEHLYDYKDSYAYAIVIEYNTAPVSPGNGSAIFLHCGNKPTAGCIAVPEPFMLQLLKWLDPEKTPVILITADEARKATI